MAQPLPVAPALALATQAERAFDVDNVVVLHDVSWEDYQRVLQIRGERPVPRLSYLEGTLQLMTPSRSHESVTSMIGRLIEAWCMERGVDISPYGSWTLESKKDERGVEPDECYVLGSDPEPARPDIAIEVFWTSGSKHKLQIYRKLGVREVWLWKKRKLELFTLRGEDYVQTERSELLPELDLALLLTFVDIKPMTRAVREYRAALSAPHE